MRSLLPLGLLALLPVLARADDTKSTVQPIKVVSLDRKEPVSYEKDVEPILVNKCAFCHSGNLKEGKLDMATYETLLKGGKRGTPLVPGKSAESLIHKLAGKSEKPFMPPKSEEPLTPQQLAALKAIFASVNVRGQQLLAMAHRFAPAKLLRAYLDRCDAAILQRLPALEHFCRYIVLTLQ